MDLLSVIVLASAEAGEEASKTPFYIAGAVLAVWAVLVSLVGMTRPATFPGSVVATRAIYVISAALVVLTLTMAILAGT